MPTATTPSSLYLLSRTQVQEIRGHDVSAVSCAGDLAPRSDSTVRVVSCEGGLLTGRPRRTGFTTVADESLRLFPFTKGDWRTEWLAATGDTIAVAITVLRNDPERSGQVPLLSRIAWVVPGSDRARIGFEGDSLAVTSLSAAISVIARSSRSRRPTVSIIAS